MVGERVRQDFICMCVCGGAGVELCGLLLFHFIGEWFIVIFLQPCCFQFHKKVAMLTNKHHYPIVKVPNSVYYRNRPEHDQSPKVIPIPNSADYLAKSRVIVIKFQILKSLFFIRELLPTGAFPVRS